MNNKITEWKCKKCNSNKKSSHKEICHKCYMDKWREKEIGIKSVRKTYLKNRQKNLIRSKKNNQKNKKKQLERNKERIKEDPFFALKVKTRTKHNNYVRYNFEEAKCNDCKKNKKIKDIEIHHPNWKFPEKYLLLCKSCHYKIHGRIYGGK